MSRAHSARRKARRKQARIAREEVADAPRSHPRGLIALIPIFIIAVILATVGILGFGGNRGIDRMQVQQKVTTLLAGIPQQGSTLGSPGAPMTLWILADLKCPTVKRYVAGHLPTFIDTWVRNGRVKIAYRSLKTDTVHKPSFLRQEAAALAAGRQNTMWNYVLTFVHEQGQKGTNYATDEFLTDIASQVPSLNTARWQHDRGNPSLFKKVIHDLHLAQAEDLRFTPSFLLDFNKSGGHAHSVGADSERKELESSLRATVDVLAEEASGDVPTLGFLGSQNGSLEETGVSQ